LWLSGIIKEYMIKNKKIIVLVIVVILGLGGGWWWYQNSQPKPKSLVGVSAIGQETKGAGDETASPEGAPASQKDDQNNSQTLANLTGTFVSSHEAGMNSIIASNCVTSAGAVCTVMFTKGDISRTLPGQTTDKEGATFWEWTPKQIGLTPGDWTIEAKASNGKQTKSAKDAEVLRIK
jgi:hypothetical protein